MKEHKFNHNDGEIVFKFDKDTIKIYAYKCNMTFDLGAILEFDSENPVMSFQNPIGVNAVAAILKELPKFKDLVYENSNN